MELRWTSLKSGRIWFASGLCLIYGEVSATVPSARWGVLGCLLAVLEGVGSFFLGPTRSSRRISPHVIALRRPPPPENRTLVLYRKKRGLGHLGEQEGVQEGSGRPFRVVKYRVFERFCVQRHVI